MKRRRNATEQARELPNVFPGREAIAPGEEFDAPDDYQWGDPIGWDDEVWPVVAPPAKSAKTSATSEKE